MPAEREATLPEPSRPTEAARIELTRLAPDTPLDTVFARACELATRALRVERAGVWFFVENGAALRCANVFERFRGEHSCGAMLRVAEFPRYFASISIRKSVPAEIAASDPRTAELAEAYLNPLGIVSMLDAGIFLRGELVGVVCNEHVGPPREWTTEDRDFAGSIADQIALRMQEAEVSELRNAFQSHEERMAALDKAEAVALLASGVAHDFRNMLTVIGGHSEMLASRKDIPADARKQALTIMDAAERGNGIVRELLEFARPDPEHAVVLSLSDALGELLPVVQSAVGPRHQIKMHRQPAIGPVLMGRSPFTRVVLNLAINARDSMPSGGAIDISLTAVRVTGPLAGPYVMLEVVDRGAGMDEATRKRACEAFFTTKSQGTGLGLAIVRRIVDRVGGFLRIDSEVGRGTAIRVFFPRIGAGTGGTAEYPVLPEN
jgi:two-component system cell cycle sensor histidine kinase/response regulator CckA